ncbi:hypothetical protein CONLIGDRAFT_92763 [Coniochaeta ligniaria NRRL 30616]|uniref:Monooxygenase n=1 Tax=Coniochaeta ligniaria NRRL 30616 TaxID=1408157 RepID=A0A1J7IWC6_9PEZI|nr:hypothetical protein CONLIGDRAFT_92763 [Coniochaeta ligniaria NRRL 30616]
MGAPTNFTGITSPSTTRRVRQSAFLRSLVKDQFSLPTLLCLGALAQASLLLLLPARWAILPAAAFALHGVLSTTLQTFFPPLNQFNKDVIPGRVSAQLPNASHDPSQPIEKPIFGTNPAGEQILVFHLGFRFSHPLGSLCPGAKEIGHFANKMYADLKAESKKYGCIGSSQWLNAGRGSKNASMGVYYFRSVEGLHAFAHGKAHRDGWDWYNAWVKRTGYSHLGIFHETFLAAPGQWETIYVDMPPTLLGATDVKVLNEESGREEFVAPLVDANNRQLRSQYGRMGRTKEGDLREA